MGRLARIVIVACCTLVVAQSLILCAATGWRAFTRFPDPDLAKMHEQQGSLTSLFDGAGLEGAGGEKGPRLIANDFTFGLFPSPAFSPEALSVTSVGGPALLAALFAMIPGFDGRSALRGQSQEKRS